MACWTFFAPSEKNKVGEQYNPDDAEAARQSLLRTHGDQLTIKIDGKLVPNNVRLK